MRAVNLLPKDADRASRTRVNPPTMVAVVTGALSLALLFSSYMSGAQRVQDKRSDVDVARARAVTNKPGEKPLTVQVELATETRKTRITALNSALAMRMPWDTVLRDVTRVIPDGVYLGSMNVSSPAIGEGAVGEVNLTGTASSFESVMLLANRLSTVPAIGEVDLGQTVRDAGTSEALNQSIYTFNITATLKAPARTGGTPA